VALPNLTRDQAVERAALVTVDNYQIALDLTDGDGRPGEHTFRSTTTVTFDALPGADTVIDIAAKTIRGATLNGHDLDVSAYDESTGIAPTVATRTPVRGCTGSSTPSIARCTCTRNSKPPTPSGCSRASTSPTSKPPSTCR
jgi:aminopeptidase N